MGDSDSELEYNNWIKRNNNKKVHLNDKLDDSSIEKESALINCKNQK